MSIDIKVCSRQEATDMEFNGDVAVISIYTPGDSPANIRQEESKILRLCFSDISDERMAARLEAAAEGGELVTPISVFTNDLARKTVDFVRSMLEAGVTRFVIHCDQGVSRSPGIAVALEQFYNYKISVPSKYALYNRLVCKKILEEVMPI